MQLLRLHKVGEQLEKSWKNIGKDFFENIKKCAKNHQTENLKKKL